MTDHRLLSFSATSMMPRSTTEVIVIYHPLLKLASISLPTPVWSIRDDCVEIAQGVMDARRQNLGIRPSVHSYSADCWPEIGHSLSQILAYSSSPSNTWSFGLMLNIPDIGHVKCSPGVSTDHMICFPPDDLFDIAGNYSTHIPHGVSTGIQER